jgi:hypothetical protein
VQREDGTSSPRRVKAGPESAECSLRWPLTPTMTNGIRVYPRRGSGSSFYAWKRVFGCAEPSSIRTICKSS